MYVGWGNDHKDMIRQGPSSSRAYAVIPIPSCDVNVYGSIGHALCLSKAFSIHRQRCSGNVSAEACNTARYLYF